MISHFELFGLKQAIAGIGRGNEHPRLVTRMLCRFVRHPIMLGFVMAFWATPDMSLGHLQFAVMTTGYILVGVWLEERDLVDHFGNAYRDYQRQVPMLVPGVGGRGRGYAAKAGRSGEHLTH